jgi:uncharacterized protein (TIGR03083 family)
MMTLQLPPIIVVHLFPEILEELLDLLSGLSAEEWDMPTACPSWSVKDVAQHLLGDDIGILSRKRDGYSPGGQQIESWEELVTLIDTLNEVWVQATRRISPRLLRDLLRYAGTQVHAYFQTLDPYAMGDPVSWAGPHSAPVWLDLAREYTERWLHQQHIREAVGRPGLRQPHLFAPVLDTFARALPHTYRDVYAPPSTLVVLTITGDSGGRWFLQRGDDHWKLCPDVPQKPQAEVIVDQDTAWRLFTKGLSQRAAQTRVTILGDQSLGLKVPDMVSIIA